MPPAGPPEEVLTARGLRIAALLSRETLPLTVEEIATKLKWAEEAVITGLARLVREERVHEDLNVDSGQWAYVLQAKPVDSGEDRQRILPIAEREAALRMALDEDDESAEADGEVRLTEKAR